MTNPTDSDRATAERVMRAMTCFDDPCVSGPCNCADTIAAALASEREACAKVVDLHASEAAAEHISIYPSGLRAIAAAIRARSNPKEK